jgi:dienelactone hydrolase
VTPSRWQHAPARRLADVAPIGWSTAAAPCLRRRTWPLICRPASFRGSRPSASEDLSWKPSAPMMILMGEDDDWTPAPPGLISSITQ